MRISAFTKLFCVASVAVAVTGCGGGGDAAATPAPKFPLQAAFKSLTAAGSTTHFVVSGACAGTSTITKSVSSSTTFEGVPAFVTTTIEDTSIPNCPTPKIHYVNSSYFDANYSLLGEGGQGAVYGKFQTLPTALPKTTNVGDAGVISVMTLYLDATKSVQVGKKEVSYSVEADTASSYIVLLTTKTYTPSDQLSDTEIDKYQLTSDGTLSFIGVDIQSGAAGAPGSFHLTYTEN